MADRGPALGVLEVATIAKGIVVADAALKRSPALLVRLFERTYGRDFDPETAARIVSHLERAARKH